MFGKKIILKIIPILILVFSFISGDLHAQDKKNKIGIIIGQWQPNLLKDEKPASVFQGTANSSPYLAINYDRSIWKEIGFHFSIGAWTHLFEEPEETSTLVITPIEVGIEHELISNSIISPYVLYGTGILLGKEIKGDKLKSLNLGSFSNTGFGFFLLTGIRFAPLKYMDFDLNFGYSYAKFPDTIGSLEDYSGVRATFGINYIF